MDEILLGALIVSGLMFLYPTIAMYYLCFVSIWLSAQFLQLLLICLLLFFNSFPFYLAVGYFFHPSLFVKSVYFNITSHQNSSFPTNYLTMQSQSHSYLSLFTVFLQKLKNQVFEFINIGALLHILLGTKIPRTRAFY